MATTFTENGGAVNGSNKEYTFSFPYLKTEDVYVALNGTTQATTKYTVSTSPTKITFNNTSVDSTVQESDGAPKTGVTVRVFRDTDVDAAKAVYASGSSVRAVDLNDNQDQCLYALQEEQTIVNNLVTTTWRGLMSSQDKVKLDAIESGATADQTDAEIRAAVEAATDSNVFTDADHSKLNAIEASATADQTDAEIRAAVEAATDSNVFTDADHTKLNAIEASADVTDATNVDAAGAVMNADTTTAAMQFVVDEDNMSSDSATKVPTQQSTKAYVDSTTSAHILDEDNFASDSATKPPSQQSTKAYIAATSQPLDSDLTTLAGMQSGTASLLAGSTALTADLSELNLLDGKSVVTTIGGSATDVQLPTAQAVNERIVELVTEVGGFVPIANETSFPATNPDVNDGAGTIVSIKGLASALTSNGSGVATIANGAGSGNTVTINGLANSTTYAAGKGLILETTTTLHTYTFHREALTSTEVTAAETLVSDFNNRYRILAAGTNISTVGSLDDGDLLWDSNTNTMKVYDASNSQWSEVTSVGDFKLLTVVPDGATSGSPVWTNTSFDLRDGSNAANITNPGQLVISVNGVIQKPNSGTYSSSGEGFYLESTNGIKFCTAPGSGASVFVTQIGSAVAVNVPADNSVATIKIQNLAVDNSKIADDTIAEGKLDIHQAPSDGKFLKYTSSNGMEWGDVPAGVTQENVEDWVGGMVTGNTETGITVTYEDSDGTLDFVVGTLNQDTTGNAAKVTVTDNPSTNENNLVAFVAGAAGSSGSQDLEMDGDFHYNPSTGTVTATKFVGDGSTLTGVAAASADGCMYKNTLTISNAHTIAVTEGAHSVGPITLNDTVTVNGRWVIS